MSRKVEDCEHIVKNLDPPFFLCETRNFPQALVGAIYSWKYLRLDSCSTSSGPGYHTTVFRCNGSHVPSPTFETLQVEMITWSDVSSRERPESQYQHGTPPTPKEARQNGDPKRTGLGFCMAKPSHEPEFDSAIS